MNTRNQCILCAGEIEQIYKFENFPIYMGVSISEENDIFNDMVWGKCCECGCVQLNSLIDLNILYKKPHNPAIGKTWKEHNDLFSNYIINSGVKNILDIGGANMKIANIVCQPDSITSYTVVDSLANQYNGEKHFKIKTINDIIENVNISEKYDGIVLSHTLEHIYDPVSMLKTLSSFLTDDGKIFISVPNIKEQLQDGFLNALNFEHTYYISHEYMKLLAINSGFELVDIFDFSKYNSFYSFKKSDNEQQIRIDKEEATKIYKDHIDNLKKDVREINIKLDSNPSYCFGSHIFTQMLIAAELSVDNIKGILDNDPDKIGKHLYGTDIMVYHPSIIKDEIDPIVILRVAQYKQEIVDQLLEYNEKVNII